MSDNVFQSKEFKDNLHKYEAARKAGSSIYLDPDELTDIAEYYHLHGKLNDALEVISTAMEMFPGATQPLAFRARAAILMGGTAEEAMSYANMIENKNDLDYYYIIAEIMIADNRTDDAEDYLEQMENQVDDEDLEDYYLDVATLFADYDTFNLAQAWLDKCEDDQEEDYIELQGRIALSRNEFEDAARIYNRLIDIDPYQVSYWNGLASAQYIASKLDDSIESSDFALAIEPDNADALLNKANCLTMLNHLEEALRLYQRYQQLQPKSEVADMGIAAIYMGKGELVKSLKHWLAAEKLCQPKSTNGIDICRNICLIYASLGQFDDALSYIEKIQHFVSFKPSEADVLHGYILLIGNQQQQAKQLFDKALEETPDTEKDNTLYFIAYSYLDCNYMQEAHQLFRQLTQSSKAKDFPDLWAYLVRTDYELGLQEEFLEDLKNATEKSPYGTIRELAEFFPSGLPIKEFLKYAANHPINKKRKQ